MLPNDYNCDVLLVITLALKLNSLYLLDEPRKCLYENNGHRMRYTNILHSTAAKAKTRFHMCIVLPES